MKKIIFISLLSCSLLFIMVSCQKDSDKPKTKTELLTMASWKFSSATALGIDVSAALQSCQKDNIYTFATGGTGTADEGATKCNAGDAQSAPFTWSWQSNETILQISAAFFTGMSGDVTLISLTETELVGSVVISGQTVTAKFVH